MHVWFFMKNVSTSARASKRIAIKGPWSSKRTNQWIPFHWFHVSTSFSSYSVKGKYRRLNAKLSLAQEAKIDSNRLRLHCSLNGPCYNVHEQIWVPLRGTQMTEEIQRQGEKIKAELPNGNCQASQGTFARLSASRRSQGTFQDK